MSAYADTNLLVRHLTSDHVEHARRATALLHGGEQLFLTAAILIETAHVLRSRYGFAREQVVGVDLPWEEPIAPDLVLDDDGSGTPASRASIVARAVLATLHRGATVGGQP